MAFGRLTPAEPEAPFAAPTWPGITPLPVGTETKIGWEDWAQEAVPCDIVDTRTQDNCPKTAEVHVLVRCRKCKERFRFYCRDHYVELKAGRLTCTVCQGVIEEVPHGSK